MTEYAAVSRFLAEVPERFSRSPHGRIAEPTGMWDHVIVFVSILVVVICVYLCIRYFLLPKEKDKNHIKRRILRDDDPSVTGSEDGR